MRQKFDNINELSGKAASVVSVILKGHGQIMLQENSVTGLLFLIGILYGSFMMAYAALLATVCGTAIAFLLNYNKTEIDKGFYGFSAALVGVAVILLFKPVFLSWVLIVLGSALATILQHFFIRRKIPAFTLPFVLVTWILLFFADNFFEDLLLERLPAIDQTSDYFTYAFKSYGQIIFQDSFVSGFIFFIAVFINSPISALYGLLGALISAVIAFKLSVPLNDISLGLYGYNAVLCAIVFAGNQSKDGIWVLISVVFSLGISILMTKFDIPQLTFPFVFASCVTLVLKNKSNSVNK